MTDKIHDRSELNDITKRVIGCAYEIHRVLGCGFLEKVYENALMHELGRHEIRAEQQVSMKVYYDDAVVGEYFADIVVEGVVLVELKAVSSLETVHEAQCLNYLKATGLRVCLLLSFGKPRLEIRRFVNNF